MGKVDAMAVWANGSSIAVMKAAYEVLETGRRYSFDVDGARKRT
jgi:hypothetical protein